MPDASHSKNELTQAESLALKIALKIAHLDKISLILSDLDDLFDEIIAQRPFANAPCLKRKEKPATPTQTPTPKNKILKALLDSPETNGTTIPTIAKITGLDKSLVTAEIDNLMKSKKIKRADAKGWARYLIAPPNTENLKI